MSEQIVTDTPLSWSPSLALVTFGLGLAATGGATLVGWVRLAFHGTIHPGHYGSTRNTARSARLTHRSHR